jgi:uncharacterized protein YecT (DUF1311 family)
VLLVWCFVFFNMRFFLLILTSLVLVKCSFSQGGIEHIKKQGYLKYAGNIDCTNHPGDELSLRICANLEYQKSDSLLVIVYEQLLKEANTKEKKGKLIQLQKNGEH